MPNHVFKATGRSRTVAATATGQIVNAGIHGSRVQGVTVRFLGSDCSGKIELETTGFDRELIGWTGPPPFPQGWPIERVRYRFRVHLTVYPVPNDTQHFYSAEQSTPWHEYTEIPGGGAGPDGRNYGHWAFSMPWASIPFTATETLVLTEQDRLKNQFVSNLVDKTLEYYRPVRGEKAEFLSFGMTASGSAVVQWVWSNPLSGTSSPGSAELPVGGSFSFGPGDRDYDAGDSFWSDVSGYDWEIQLSNPSPDTPLSATVAFSDSSLNSTYPSQSIASDVFTFAGTPHSCSLVSTEPPGGSTATGVAVVTARPSYGINVAAKIYGYQDGALQSCQMEHCWSVAGSLGIDPVPAVLNTWDPTAGPLALGPYHDVNIELETQRLPAAPVITQRGELTNPYSAIYQGSGTGFNLFRLKPQWLDDRGSYFNSAHWFVRGRESLYYTAYRRKWLSVAAGPQFDAGSIQFNSTHAFGAFGSTGNWRQAVQRDDFLAQHPEYNSSVAIAAVGAGVRFTVTNPWSTQGVGVVSTSGLLGSDPHLYRWRFLAFRNATIRVSPPVAGARFRLQIGTQVLPFDGVARNVYGQYAWEIEVPATGWNEVEVDLARPDLVAMTVDTGGVPQLSWQECNEVIAPLSWFRGPFVQGEVGPPVYLELMSEGAWGFETLVGTRGSDEPRTPILAVAPLEGRGDGYPYEPGLPAETYQDAEILRCLVNGVHGFSLSAALNYDTGELNPYLAPGVVGGGSFEGFWQNLYDALQDCGITVDRRESTTHPYRTFPLVDNHRFPASEAGLPFWSECSPGGAHVLKSRIRTSEWRGYYGMGNPLTGAYGATLVATVEWVLDGEVAGNVMLDHREDKTVAIQLHDNPGGAVLAASSADLDGLYRLPWRYGVKTPLGNTADTAATGDLLARMNNYWLKSDSIEDMVDSVGYLAAGDDPAVAVRLTPQILDRYCWRQDLGVLALADGISMVRDHTWQIFLFLRSLAGSMVCFRYDRQDQNPTASTIESGSCSSPTFWLRESVIEGTYLAGQIPKLARTRDHGATWQVTTIPGSYTALASCPHKGRIVFIGYRGASLYCRVGSPRYDAGVLAFQWSNEVLISLAAVPSKRFTVSSRPGDEVPELSWLDTSSVARIARAPVLSKDGVGAWQ